MQNTVFKFESGWNFTLAMILGPVGMVLYIFFPHFLKMWRETRTNGVVIALRRGFRRILWLAVWATVILGAFWTLKVGANRNLVGVEVSDKLVLDYSWPRSDAIINWAEVLKGSSESKKNGVSGSTWFRLTVATGNHTYGGLWMASSREVIQVGEAVTSALAKQKPPG